MSKFNSIEKHKGFRIKNLFPASTTSEFGRGDLAVILPGGAGPEPSHQHAHGHLFTVIEGSIEISLNGNIIQLNQYESICVPTNSMHTMRNNTTKIARILGIELHKETFTAEATT